MKRKVTLIALSLVLALLCVFVLVACDDPNDGDGDNHTHTASDWIIDEQPSCTSVGRKHKECTVCFQQMESDVISMLSHTISEWIIDEPSSCTSVGSKHKECTVCLQPLEIGVVPALNHKISEWIIDEPSSCTDSGRKHKECTLCFQWFEDEIIPIADHKLQHFDRVPPTITTEGRLEYWHCSTCETNFSDENAEDICWDYELKPYLEFTLSEDETYYIVSGNNITSAMTLQIPATYKNLPVSSIGDSAFYCCPITAVTIPDSIETVEYNAFSRSGLNTVVIPDSVKTIGINAFSSCEQLTELTIGKSVNYIGLRAFMQCEKLVAVNYNCIELKDDKVAENISPFVACGTASSGFVLNIGKQVKSIPSYFCFPSSYIGGVSDDINITEIRFENDSVCKSIGEGAFYKTTVTTVNLPESITRIGQSAFAFSEHLVEISMPGVQTIESIAFSDCKNLRTVKIGDKIENIESNAFQFCEKLNKNTYDNALYLGNDDNKYLVLLQAKNKEIQTVSIHADTKVICPGAFENCVSLFMDKLTIPNGVISANGCFAYCQNIKAVEIPASVKYFSASWTSYINYTVDANNAYYKSVNGSVYSKDGKTLFSYYFKENYEENELHVIPEDVEIIKANAIVITSTQHVLLPSGLKQVDGYSAVQAPYHGKVYFKGSQEEWLALTGEFYVPDDYNYVYYYSETQVGGCYWHYDTDGTTPVIWSNAN